MDLEKNCAGRPIDAFAWQYAFYAHLVYRREPATQGNLSHLAQTVYAMRSHQDPKEAAYEVLAEWPFEPDE